MADDVVLARLAQLEIAVRKAGEALARLQDDNARLTQRNAQLEREANRIGDERRQILTQIDMLLKDIGKLDLE
jgi:cell division protein FtsB